MKRSLQELTIKDAFMFAAVMSDPKPCKTFLSMVLDMEILEVTVIAEKTLAYRPEYHGVRLDVLAEEKGTKRRFNVEMQVKREKDLPRRSRYYHAQIDMDALLAGEEYEDLPDTYVIFICDYDPWGKNLYCHTLRTFCEETGEAVPDGSITYWLSTKGTNDSEVSEALRSFLKYVEDPGQEIKKESSAFVLEVDKQIASIKRSREWEAKFMLLKEILSDERKQGYEDGYSTGKEDGYNIGKEDGYNSGKEAGFILSDQQKLLKVLQKKGEISEELQSAVLKQNDAEILERWFNDALDVKSIEEFISKFKE